MNGSEKIDYADLYRDLRQAMMKLQRENAELEVALGTLRNEYRTAAGICICGAYGQDHESE